MHNHPAHLAVGPTRGWDWEIGRSGRAPPVYKFGPRLIIMWRTSFNSFIFKKKSIQQSSLFGWVQTQGFGDSQGSPGVVDPWIDHQWTSSFQTLLQPAVTVVWSFASYKFIITFFFFAATAKSNCYRQL